MAFGPHPATIDSENYGLLVCKCGGDNLHQEDVTVFQRVEDDNVTTVIAQDGKTVQVSDFPSQDTCNPSPRRHGMLIQFYCEHCEGPLRLAIYQHKGSTFMEWVD